MPAADNSAERFPALHAFQARIRAIAREVDLEREKTNSTNGDDSDDDAGGGAAEIAEEKLRRCLAEHSSVLYLFRREKTPEGAREREKFLAIVKKASRHLLLLYFDPPQADGAPPNLASHPSVGVKKLADGVHNLLGRHWRCRCQWRQSAGSREARLSLTRHRQFLLTVPAPPRPTWARKDTSKDVGFNAKFEVLLPVCTACVSWKVTNVHAMAQV